MRLLWVSLGASGVALVISRRADLIPWLMPWRATVLSVPVDTRLVSGYGLG